MPPQPSLLPQTLSALQTHDSLFPNACPDCLETAASCHHPAGAAAQPGRSSPLGQGKSQAATISFLCLSLRGFGPCLHQAFWDEQPVPKAASCHLHGSVHTTSASGLGRGYLWGWVVQSAWICR